MYRESAYIYISHTKYMHDIYTHNVHTYSKCVMYRYSAYAHNVHIDIYTHT